MLPYARPGWKKMRNATVHVDYECCMLFETARRLDGWGGSHPTTAREGVERKTVLESWLVHVRSLMQFFQAQRMYKDDVLARDYLSDPMKWTGRGFEASAKERRRLDNISKFVAHISYARNRRQATWRMADQHMVVQRLDAWLALLQPRRRGWFPSLVAKLAAPPFGPVSACDPP